MKKIYFIFLVLILAGCSQKHSYYDDFSPLGEDCKIIEHYRQECKTFFSDGTVHTLTVREYGSLFYSEVYSEYGYLVAQSYYNGGRLSKTVSYKENGYYVVIDFPSEDIQWYSPDGTPIDK